MKQKKKNRSDGDTPDRVYMSPYIRPEFKPLISTCISFTTMKQ